MRSFTNKLKAQIRQNETKTCFHSNKLMLYERRLGFYTQVYQEKKTKPRLHDIQVSFIQGFKNNFFLARS